MADPISLMAVASLVGTAVGGGVSAFGAIGQGQSAKAMANYQAGVAQVNQQIADQNASYALAAGETEAQTVGMQTRARIGQTKAAQGASNLDVNKGSTVDVRASEAEVGAEDQAMTRANAARTAYGYEVQKTGQQAQEQIQLATGKNAVIAADFQAASSLLGASTSVADKWYKMSAAGVPGFGGTSSPKISDSVVF